VSVCQGSVGDIEGIVVLGAGGSPGVSEAEAGVAAARRTHCEVVGRGFDGRWRDNLLVVTEYW